MNKVKCALLCIIICYSTAALHAMSAKAKPVVKHIIIMYDKESDERIIVFCDVDWKRIFSKPYEGSINVDCDLKREEIDVYKETMEFRLISVEDWT